MARKEKQQKGIVRAEYVSFRCTEEEKDFIERLSRGAGISMGQMLRRMVVREWEIQKTQILAVERARKLANTG